MNNLDFDNHKLSKEYLNYCNYKNNGINNGCIDLSMINFFYPSLLLPLGIFIKNNPDLKIIPPRFANVSFYFDLMMEKKNVGKNESYIPIMKVPLNPKERDRIVEKFTSMHDASYFGGRNTLSYFVGELIDNIYDHSRFSEAYIMAQKYKKSKFTEICIIDNGISIPKSYELKNYKIRYDSDALNMALDGVSTKSSERGFGLRTSLEILREGLNASCLIATRGVGLISNKSSLKISPLNKEKKFNGTLISARIPLKTSEVDIYEFIDR